MHLWTIQIVGGQPHVIQTQSNKVYRHNGKLSVWHVLCDEESVQHYVLALEAGGCKVNAFSEYPSYIQTELRTDRFDAHQSDFVYPTKSCPTCFFFSPENKESPCGVLFWDRDFFRGCLQKHPKARIDLVACPRGE